MIEEKGIWLAVSGTPEKVSHIEARRRGAILKAKVFNIEAELIVGEECVLKTTEPVIMAEIAPADARPMISMTQEGFLAMTRYHIEHWGGAA